MARNHNTAPWATTPDDEFNRYVERTEQYNAAIEHAGDTPWHGNDIEARRELWERRYRRPDPPQGLTIPNVRNKK
ncbi:hypothetical protein [Mycolicibacter sinensis]|uniref:hypothetical protein n=1 Tax=Mycolicibacter sinensis (strain JDM601) TaxID=875328 RepID=UPI001041CE3F|nr:hypothetical protein [Mycolicibacter sinensis]